VTLMQGDTTIFRTTAVGASCWTVTGYQFVPVETPATLALLSAEALRTVGSPVDRLISSPIP